MNDNKEFLTDSVTNFWESSLFKEKMTEERRFAKFAGCLIATFYGLFGCFVIAWILGLCTLLWLGIRWLWLNT